MSADGDDVRPLARQAQTEELETDRAALLLAVVDDNGAHEGRAVRVGGGKVAGR